MTIALHLDGLGTSAPPFSISQPDAESRAAAISGFSPDDQRKLRLLYRASGVKQRGSVLLEPDGQGGVTQNFYGVRSAEDDRGPSTAERMSRYEAAAADLAEQAALRALRAADCSPTSIAHLITVSCTGFSAPGFDFALIDRLGLAPTVSRTHVGFMGCHGTLNGLRVAGALASQSPGVPVLLAAVELSSLHHFYGWHPDRLVANALFADGAAAVVGSARPAETGKGAWRLIAQGSTVLPGTSDLMSWRIGDHGFEMTLSAQVPGVIIETLRPWMEQWLSTTGIPLDDIRSWAVHPGGPRILSAVEEALSLPDQTLSVSRDVLAHHGNMSSPTVLFILDRLRRHDAPLPCVALGFGPGLAIEAVLFG